MADIERNERIRFHERGTLEAVTRWMASDYDGIAEWLKNVRCQYQTDRANVAIDHRVALILLQDATGSKSARIGALGTAGASLKDYMCRLFADPARILGVRDMKKTTKTAKQLIARVDAAKSRVADDC